MTEKVYIYGLYDPVSGCLKYIGQTDNPDRRKYQHTGRPGMYTGNARVSMWVTELHKKYQISPIFRVICVIGAQLFNRSEVNRVERELIQKCFLDGCDLYNNVHLKKLRRAK